MNIRKMIIDHTDSIVKGNFSSPDIVCPSCHQKPEVFKLHESRKRLLRLIEQDIVNVTISFLLRWRCLICGATFTEYPPFVVPHKRYVFTDIIKLGEKYLINADLSYRDVVKHNGADIGYPDAHGLCDRFLSHSSVWRFMGYLADMCRSRMVRIHLPGERPPSIPISKYRSHHRRSLLHKAFQAILLFCRQVNQKIFPSFETGHT